MNLILSLNPHFFHDMIFNRGTVTDERCLPETDREYVKLTYDSDHGKHQKRSFGPMLFSSFLLESRSQPRRRDGPAGLFGTYMCAYTISILTLKSLLLL